MIWLAVAAFLGSFAGVQIARAVGAWTVRRAFERMKAEAYRTADSTQKRP